MTSRAAPEQGRGDHGWQDILLTALLVVAALGTSWSSYQATRWNGEQAAASSRTSAIRVDTARAQGLAEAQTEIDVATFIAWADAHGRDEQELAEFYVDRFRAEFVPAFDAWIASKPFEDPDAAPTPFALPEYHLAASTEAERLDAAAEDSAAEVREYIQRASNYVLTVVFYAVALFFAGIATRTANERLRWVLFGAGAVALLGAIVWVATLPVSLAV